MSWTRTNFRRLRDTSPAAAPMRWAMARGALRTKDLGVSRFTFEPGARMPHGHRHREQEEVYVVVRGSGRFKLDDEVIDVAEGDAIRVSPPVMRAYEAGPDGLDLICIGGRRPPGNDTETDHDFWN